jgi:hypothetical protein
VSTPELGLRRTVGRNCFPAALAGSRIAHDENGDVVVEGPAGELLDTADHRRDDPVGVDVVWKVTQQRVQVLLAS